MVTDDGTAVWKDVNRAGICAIIVVLSPCFSVAGCIGQPSGAVDTSPAVVVRDVTVHEAAFLIEKNIGTTEFIIIDVRTPEEYSQGFIAGSVTIDTRDPAFTDRLGELDLNREYFL
ncbi:MAG: rhodanese-like domain-containing protein [Methanomicrobiaceae archaeon]|nr:rhodanese-like domain-containing protein [Methanomicrobiaceae archaeon]